MPDFLPRRDGQLLAWAAGFGRGISEDPQSLGLTPAQADAYDSAYTAMAYEMHLASSGSTRTAAVVLQKSESTAALKSLARTLARIVRANPDVSANRRMQLGLDPGNRAATKILAPDASPDIQIKSVVGQRVTLRLYNTGEPSRSGIPRGTIGAQLFTCLSEDRPEADAFWQPQGLTSTARMMIEFPASIRPGAQVWFAARWLSPRLKPGPMSSPVSTRVQGGIPSNHTGVRIAA